MVSYVLCGNTELKNKERINSEPHNIQQHNKVSPGGLMDI